MQSSGLSNNPDYTLKTTFLINGLSIVMTSLFEKYGGFDVFSAVVASFYQKVLDSDKLAPYFDNIDMERLMSHQTTFIATALGGPDTYQGKDLRKVHAPYKITVPHFQEVGELLAESLEEAGVEDHDIETIMKLISGLMEQIVSTQ